MSGFYPGYWDEYHREPKTPRMCLHRSGVPAASCKVCSDAKVIELMDALAKAEEQLEVRQST
jgi:hypothetical protein